MPHEIVAPIPHAPPSDALFIARCESDYNSAEITSIAHLASGETLPTHLFAVVELLHGEIESNPLIGVAPPDGYPRRTDMGKQAGKLLLQRWTLSVRQGLDWYRACSLGTMLVPGTRTPIRLRKLGSDPPWPYLVVEVERFWSGTQFWGNRAGGSRWHRLLPLEAVDITGGWKPSDFESARKFLLAEAHLDLLSRSVLLGSCHLQLPNPVYRHLHRRVADNWKGITFEVVPFPNRASEPLELTFWNHRAWGATEVRRLSLHAGSNFLSIPEGVEQMAHAVTSPSRGLLEQSEVAGFITSVRAEMNLVGEYRRVQGAHRSDGTASADYTVGIIGDTQVIEVGDARPVEALSRLATDEDQQQVRGAWSRFSITWFDKNAAAGTQALRDIIGTARERVDFLDPYFGRGDLREFAIATTRHGMPVRVLTSAEFCRTKDDELLIESGEALLRAVESVQNQDPRFRIEIKVMAGAKSPVHDRFLIVDDSVWLLGASLNEFGSRGTLLLRLPAAPLSQDGGATSFSISSNVFDSHWGRKGDQSAPLDEWVTRRSARRIAAQRARSVVDRIRETKTLATEAFHRIMKVWRA